MHIYIYIEICATVQFVDSVQFDDSIHSDDSIQFAMSGVRADMRCTAAACRSVDKVGLSCRIELGLRIELDRRVELNRR